MKFVSSFVVLKLLTMTSEEYTENFIKRMREDPRKPTPKEALQTFVELGILDADGNVMPGREALFSHLLNFNASKKA